MLILEKDNTSDIFSNNQRAFGPFVLSLGDVRPHLLNPGLSDAEITRLVKEMSLKFTQKREHIEDYVLSRDMVSAYAAFYLPTNIPKLHFLLSKLTDSTLADLKGRPFIDMGAGPGTFSLGYHLLMGSDAGHTTIVDTSVLMQQQAQQICKGFFPDVSLEMSRHYRLKNRESILFFGHSINEMGVQEALEHVMVIDPEYIIWIEPGTSELFSELKKLRGFIADDYDVLYPCPSMKGCPSSWCHQVLRTSHDPSIERLSQLIGLDRKILPMAAHVYRRKQSGSKTANLPTLIRYMTETKFSFEYEVCLEENGKNKNVVVEYQKKNLGKNLEKRFKNLSVGEKARFEVDRIIGEKYRVILK